jgi:hypothetical protein
MTTHIDVPVQKFDWGAPSNDPRHGHAWLRAEDGLQVAACDRRCAARNIDYRTCGWGHDETLPCAKCAEWLARHHYPMTGYRMSSSHIPLPQLTRIFLAAVAALVLLLGALSLVST